MGCLRLFALCSANTYSPFLFSRASSSAQIASSCLSDGAHSPSLCAISGFSSPRRSLKWLCFPTAIQWHPQPEPAKEVCLPKLEPGPVYTNSSEKYGRIIILVVSFNVTSLWWQPLHAVGCLMKLRSGRGVNGFTETCFILRHKGAPWRKIRTVWSEANKHEAQGSDRVCCGCPTHKCRF